MALSEAASPAVVPALVRMIKRQGEDPEVIRAAVAGIGRAGVILAGQSCDPFAPDAVRATSSLWSWDLVKRSGNRRSRCGCSALSSKVIWHQT